MRAWTFAFAVTVVGCADKGDEGMFILNNTAPVGTICTLTSDPLQPFIAQGSIAANSPSGYLLTPLIESRIDANAGQAQERSIHLEGANIILSSVGSDGKLANPVKFTSLFSGTVPPLGAVNVAFDILPAASTVTNTNLQFNANITVFGTLGGGRIDAEPFDYPVTVCTNCITIDHGACPMAASVNLGNPCNVFQDGLVDCCTMNNTLVCPGSTM